MISQLCNMQLFPAIWWWTEMSDTVLSSFLHTRQMHTSWWCNFQPTLISILFFLNWLSLASFSTDLSQYNSMNFWDKMYLRIFNAKYFTISFQYLMILGTEDNTDWNEQKNEQVSYVFTWSHSHSLGTK